MKSTRWWGAKPRSRGIRVPAAIGILALAAWCVAPAGAETRALSSLIAAAPPGEANGHLFSHLLELAPEDTCTGGAMILEDTCIRGNGATLLLENECLLVAPGAGPTRFDVDHCLIRDGGLLGYGEYGGGIEYGAGTQGWALYNTLYNNSPYGIYLHEVVAAPGAVRVVGNIVFRNGNAGIVRNEEQPDVEIRYNDSIGHAQANFAKHCGCPNTFVEEIFPGLPPEDPELDESNFSADPVFVQTPEPPKIPGDFHLADGSPCIGVGPAGEDLGAYPYGLPPLAEPTSWGALKARFRD